MLYFKTDNPMVPGSSPGGGTNYTKRLVDFRLTAFLSAGFLHGINRKFSMTLRII